MDDTLDLRDGRWHIVVAPSLGGSLLACEYDGMPVLKPTAQPERLGRLPALHCCYFPLIPYSNRIENGLFRFRGVSIRPAEEVAGAPHAIHGHGWLAEWRITGRNGTGCALSFCHAPASDWPWPYQGRQTLAIVDDELRITLAIENLGTTAMPCGLGFHPFLPASGGARLQMQAARVWDGTADAFPSQRVAVPGRLDFRSGPRVADRQGTNHCFDGWPGRATVSYEHAPRRLALDGCEATHSVIVYIPEDADYFCVEPVTHTVNAMNLPNAAESGLWTLEPQETRQITMSIRCDITGRDLPRQRSRTSDRSP
jgi:aldose 1-epimerase